MTEEEIERKFAKDFNNGYFMQKHEPELLEKILKSNNQESETINAMALGKRQHEKYKMSQEHKQSLERQKLNKNRNR